MKQLRILDIQGTKQMPFPGQCIQVGQYMTCLHCLASGSKFSCWLVYVLKCRQSILLLTVNVSFLLYDQLKMCLRMFKAQLHYYFTLKIIIFLIVVYVFFILKIHILFSFKLAILNM